LTIVEVRLVIHAIEKVVGNASYHNDLVANRQVVPTVILGAVNQVGAIPRTEMPEIVVSIRVAVTATAS